MNNPRDIPIIEITYKPSVVVGDLDKYSIADGQNALAIIRKLQEAETNVGDEGCVLRIFEQHRLEILLTTGSDRDDTSNQWDTDPGIPAGDKIFLHRFDDSLYHTLATLGMRYIHTREALCVSVFNASAFNLVNPTRIYAEFVERDPQTRLGYVQRVYAIKPEQT